MADEIGIPRRREYMEYGRRFGWAAANAAFWGQLPGLMPQSRMKRRRGTSYEFEMGSKRKQSLASKAYVQKCMRSIAEKKEITVVNSVGNGGVPTAAGRVDSLGLFNIIQGTADDQRTGNIVDLTHATMRFTVEIPAAMQRAYYRIIVFKDTNTNGAVPAFADVLATAATTAGYNGDNVKKVGGARFVILVDKFFVVNSVYAAGAHARTFVVNIRGDRLGKIRYDGTAGTIADIVSGDLNILTISDQATATVNVTTQYTYQDG